MDGVRHCNPVRLERAPSGHAVARAQGSGLGEQEKRSQPSNTRMDGGKMKSSNAAPAAIHVDSVSLRYACVMTPGEVRIWFRHARATDDHGPIDRCQHGEPAQSDWPCKGLDRRHGEARRCHGNAGASEQTAEGNKERRISPERYWPCSGGHELCRLLASRSCKAPSPAARRPVSCSSVMPVFDDPPLFNPENAAFQ